MGKPAVLLNPSKPAVPVLSAKPRGEKNLVLAAVLLLLSTALIVGGIGASRYLRRGV